MGRRWVELCEGNPNDVYPRSVRVLSPRMRVDFPKQFTDAELTEHLSDRCGSDIDSTILDADGFLFGGVVYKLMESETNA